MTLLNGNKTAVLVCLIVFVMSRPVLAQKNHGAGWPAPQTGPKGAKTPAVEMISSGPVSVSMDPSVFGVAGAVRWGEPPLVSPPFPVAMPVAILYPEKAMKRGWEGRTVVAAEIRPDGTVGRTALAQSSGYDILDNAARDSIRTWQFKVADGDTNAVPQFVDIPVTFKLEGEDGP